MKVIFAAFVLSLPMHACHSHKGLTKYSFDDKAAYCKDAEIHPKCIKLIQCEESIDYGCLDKIHAQEKM